MFYYGIDALEMLPATSKIILMKNNFRNSGLEVTVNYPIHYVSAFGLLWHYIKIVCLRIPVFSPTAHCLPFIKMQICVIHDAYPFYGSVFRWKYYVLQLLYYFSRPIIFYINQTNSKKLALQLRSKDVFYFPNGIRASTFVEQPSTKRLSVGLFGADHKKNYDILFRAAVGTPAVDISYYIYCVNNEYIRKIKARFPFLDISIIDSSVFSIEDFLSRVDVVASIATGEGFCRPLAISIAAGRPAFLINDEVFREFYSQCASFSSSGKSLLASILDHGRATHLGATCPLGFSELLRHVKHARAQTRIAMLNLFFHVE